MYCPFKGLLFCPFKILERCTCINQFWKVNMLKCVRVCVLEILKCYNFIFINVQQLTVPILKFQF